MNLILQTDAEARDVFADSEQWPASDGVDHGARPTPAMLRTLADLADVLPDDATLTVCRDWEGCPVGILGPGDAEIAAQYGVGDVLALTTEGRIGSGGVNQPAYFDSVAQYVSHNLRRALAR